MYHLTGTNTRAAGRVNFAIARFTASAGNTKLEATHGCQLFTRKCRLCFPPLLYFLSKFITTEHHEHHTATGRGGREEAHKHPKRGHRFTRSCASRSPPPLNNYPARCRVFENATTQQRVDESWSLSFPEEPKSIGAHPSRALSDQPPCELRETLTGQRPAQRAQHPLPQRNTLAHPRRHRDTTTSPHPPPVSFPLFSAVSGVKLPVPAEPEL